jgi:hypothetical protein
VNYATAPLGHLRRDGKPLCGIDGFRTYWPGSEELRFELPALGGGDCLRATEASYPSRQQGYVRCFRYDVRYRNDFRPACKTDHPRKAVHETVRCREWTYDVDVHVLEPGCRQGDVSQRLGGVTVYLRPLPSMACSCPDAAVLQHAGPYVAMGNKFHCRPCPEVAKTVESIEYLPPEGFGNVRERSGCRHDEEKNYLRTVKLKHLQL